MATIKDVAKAANVSIATVSRVINKSPKASKASIASVTQAMQALGYRPNAAARALVSQSSQTIGVLVSDVSDPFFGAMIKAIDTVANKQGKHLLIGNGYHSKKKEKEAIELLINHRCDALVVHSKGLSNEELIQFAQEVPGLVVINRFIPEMAERCIYLDNEKGAFLATEYLIKQGHSHIAYLCSDQDIEDSSSRKSGYLRALSQYGLSHHPDYIQYGSPNEEGGQQATEQLLENQKNITAIAAFNDYMAAGALNAIEEKGLSVPRDLSLVGFDDGLIAKFLRPKLTTVHYPIDAMAEQAAHLANLLANKQANTLRQISYRPNLVKRASVRTLD
ncbi:substrate-binding domain-containing protein [Marinomonas epiphytica]